MNSKEFKLAVKVLKSNHLLDDYYSIGYEDGSWAIFNFRIRFDTLEQVCEWVGEMK